MKTAYDIIRRPVITEQSMADTENKKYVFGQHPARHRKAQAHRPVSRRTPAQLEEGSGYPV